MTADPVCLCELDRHTAAWRLSKRTYGFGSFSVVFSDCMLLFFFGNEHENVFVLNRLSCY